MESWPGFLGARAAWAPPGLGSLPLSLVPSSAPALHINSNPPITSRPQFLFPERTSFAFDLS